MNKGELVKAVAAKTGLSQKDTEATLNSIINVVSDELANKGKVQLIGFGTFETRERAARTVPAFKAGKALKEKVNK